MLPQPALSVLILPEDGANDAHETLKALAKAAFKLVDPNVNTLKDRLDFEPMAGEHKRLVTSALWKGRPTHPDDRKAFLELIVYMATKLSEPNGFVIFHVDGDSPYTERAHASNAKKNPQRFKEVIEKELRAYFVGKKVSEPEIERRLARILKFFPYYSLEAWLYQNIPVAKALCAQNHQSACHGTFAAWESDRAALDEIEKVKERCCLRSRHNLELAEKQFPADRAYAAGKSFKDAVDLASSSVALKGALAKTYSDDAPVRPDAN
jgi:hypothetical protein